jgi:rRNA maturation endonuclease Nob1
MAVPGRIGNEAVCQNCGSVLRQEGRYCPSCGSHLAQRVVSDGPNLPRYQKRVRRVVSSVRCSAFHHELLVTVFKSNFCPECGRRLILGLVEPEVG